MSNRKQRRADKARRREHSAAHPVYEKMVQIMLASPKVKVIDPKHFDDSAHTFGTLFRLRGTPPFMHQRETVEEVDRTYFDGCYAEGEKLLAQDVLQLWVKGDKVQVNIPGLYEALKEQADRLAFEHAVNLANHQPVICADAHPPADSHLPPVKLTMTSEGLKVIDRLTGEVITSVA